ncbi:hypothetical protein IMAU50079_00586 [Lactobacillus helveticus]|nr:ACT domain-containing protein [Lactobacillus helveticus]NRO65870.1 hypothetical protein [Lactobacillus helveticus]
MKAILTISGEDKIGIIAQISKILAEEEIDILNISQNLMDNNFTTTIMIKITDGKDLKKIDKRFDNLGNQMGAKKHNDRQLMAIRRTIESDFSLLTHYNAENNRARSLTGFQARLEIAILTYNLAYCLERFN